MKSLDKIKGWADEYLQGDRVIWAVVIALSGISVLVVYSSIGTLAYRRMVSPEYYLMKHTMMVLLGLGAMWVAHKIDYRYYSKLSRFGLWVSVPLLLYTYKFGQTLNDASRWINIPIINQTFQPSDFASLVLIMSLASMLSKKQENIEDISQTLLPMLGWISVICLLIALSNISTAILLFITCMLIMFIGRVPVKYLALLLLFGSLTGVVAYKVSPRIETAINRINSYMNDDEPPFQVRHSLIAVATGGVTGKGPGNSDQRNILPHPYSDFIYSIVIEEYGMVGGILVILLYLVFLHRGMKAAYNSELAFGGLLSAGLSFDLVCQAMVNMGVVLHLGPVTGQPLPFVSWGGTAMIFSGLSAGIILSVSRGATDKTWGELSDKKETTINEMKPVTGKAA
ncbi:MAG: cell division protein FtsW [Bacteroidetes bacterium]|nr:cell division protein FtsW [Bacteroidota bacterium]